jgi:hypothetical protein
MTPQYIEITEHGSKFYYKNKKMTILHREDGPAVECADGSKVWCFNGKVHREDGPAAIYSDGYKSWYLNGERLSEEEFNEKTSKEIVLTMDEIAAKLGIEVSKLKITK